MHWTWEGCPKAWAGQFTGPKGQPTVILEAVADRRMYIWHSYFGVPGVHNNLTVLSSSPLFQTSAADEVPFTIKDRSYQSGYYLVDGIYPKWPVLIGSIPSPSTEAQRCYSLRHEAVRKDIERAFGRL